MFSKKNQCRFIFFIITMPSLLFLVYFCHRIWGFTVDDAFIEFRYVENFVQTGDILWNLGASPTEGCTSFAHLLLLSFFHYFGMSSLASSKIVGIGSVALVYYIIFIHLSCDWRSAVLWGLLFDFFAMNFGTPVHMVSGLETTFYTCLVFMLCMSYTEAMRQGSRFIVFSLLSLLCGLARPESNAYIFFLFSITLFFLSSIQRKKLIFSGLIFYVLPAVIYFLWRAWYFGLLFPLPFYTKVEGGALAGVHSVFSFVFYTLPFFISSFCILYFSLKKNKGAVVGFLIILVIMFLFVINVKQVMAFESRYLYPSTAVLLASGFFIAQQKETRKNALIKIFSVCLIFYCILQAANIHHNINYFLDYTTSEENIYGKLGKQLSILDSKHNLLVISDAGIVPYYSKLPTIDYWSLTDSRISSEHMDDYATASYIFSTTTPTVLVLLSHDNESGSNFSLKKDSAIYKMAIEKEYCVLNTLKNMDGDYLWILVPRRKLAEFKFMSSHKKILAQEACFLKDNTTKQ